jgi:hypothetical protein
MRSGNFASHRLAQGVLAAAAVLGVVCAARAEPESDYREIWKMPSFRKVMRMTEDRKDLAVQFLRASVPGNALWPGDQVGFAFQVVNRTGEALTLKGRVDVIRYGLVGNPDDIWDRTAVALGDGGSTPVEFRVDAKGFTNVTVKPSVPETFGAYGIILDVGPRGRYFVTSCIRTFRHDAKMPRVPQFTLDNDYVPLLVRIGAARNRVADTPYLPTTDPGFGRFFAEKIDKPLAELREAGLPVLLEFGAGAFDGPTQPLGTGRPFLDEAGVMAPDLSGGKMDGAWLPSYDEDWKKYVKMVLRKYGWPKGPVMSVDLWNEPWNGVSISGWGADDLRYREIYTKLGEAVDELRREEAIDVMIGGCDSSSNTFDKLFPDGKDTFLKWLDFCTIHYQGLDIPSVYKPWRSRQGPHGPVRAWDEESWVANADDRVAGTLAPFLAAGYERVVGIVGNVVSTDWFQRPVEVFGDDGKKTRVEVSHTYPVAAAVGAMTHFIGQRKFQEILFKNGLPWVYVFSGLPGADGKENIEDRTIVVVGDIGASVGFDRVLLRTVRGLAEVKHKEGLRAKLAALAADAPAEDRTKLEKALATPETLSGATMTLSDGSGFLRAPRLFLYDFYGNPVPSKGGKIVVPLDHRGFFLRADGKPGSFDALRQAIETADIRGYEPLETVCLDMLAPVTEGAVLRLRLTNILNRPVSGTLKLTLGRLRLDAPEKLSFRPHEIQMVSVKIVGGDPAPDNSYPLGLVFDAGRDGAAVHEEVMHCNVIAHRTITVDGKLDDWKDVLPQPLSASGRFLPSMTEAAWWPFKPFDTSAKSGYSVGYLAYDKDYFYLAVKAADRTRDPGTVRFETRNDDEWFYPEVCYKGKEKTPLKWPEGVRRFSYRKSPDLPDGTSPPKDNVQIGFNVLAPAQKESLETFPGTMPKYVTFNCLDTDYEYALNLVAPRYGGGTEVWRMASPGMPHKHFYPHSLKSPFDGPVKDARLVITYDGNTRITECAIPWSEMPAVKKALDEGRTIKLTYRVNDNDRTWMELAQGRSVVKHGLSLHPDWTEHWGNEIEFAWGR